MTDKMKIFVKGLMAGLVSKGRMPEGEKKEPIGYLYGHVAGEGETPTHTIDGIGYVGVVTPDIYTFYTPELQEQYPYIDISEKKYSSGSLECLFFAHDRQPWATMSGNSDISPGILAHAEPSNYITCKYRSGNTAWGELSGRNVEYSSTANYIISYLPGGAEINGYHYARYANFEARYDSQIGIVVSCDPIPVYE